MRVVSLTPGFVPALRYSAEIESEILNFVQGNSDDPEDVALARSAANRGIDRLNTHRWRKVRKWQNIPVVVGTVDYVLAFDFKDVLFCEVLNTDGIAYKRLDYKFLERFLHEHVDATSSGTPRIYTVFHQQRYFSLDKSPDQGFVDMYPWFRVQYEPRIPYLDGTAQRIEAPPEHASYIEAHGQAAIAAVRSPQRLNYAVTERNRIWRELIVADEDTQTDWSANHV